MENTQLLENICRAFFPDSIVKAVEEIKIGHINQTYKVKLSIDDLEKDCLLQAINTYVFKQPVQIMENIEKITAHMAEKDPDGCRLCFYKTADGKNYLEDDSGFWRLCNYIPSANYSSGRNTAIVREAGAIFGKFQQQLSDFDASLLYETIPNFHNTIKRYEALEASAAADKVHRMEKIQKEFDQLMSMKDSACTLTSLYNEGKLPLRVTHNDTKINNVLFDLESDKALTVIDLDTVMPGLIGHDFGDAIRSSANPVAEDVSNFEKAKVDIDIFRAFAEGYLSVLGHSLTDTELDTLALSAFCQTAEQAVRFLTDYLDGDVYFKIDYPEHNLVRTRCQIALAQSMIERMDEMNAIITKLIK